MSHGAIKTPFCTLAGAPKSIPALSKPPLVPPGRHTFTPPPRRVKAAPHGLGEDADPLPHALPHGSAHCRTVLIAAARRFTHKKPVFIAFGVSQPPSLPHENRFQTPPLPHFYPTVTPPKPHVDPTWTPPKPHVAPSQTPPKPHVDSTRDHYCEPSGRACKSDRAEI